MGPESKNEFIIIGIDPASGKGLHYCCKDEESHVDISKSRAWLIEQKKKHKNLIVCWDAPLTGPPMSVVQCENPPSKGNFTQRPIESFFRKPGDFMAPPGIFVGGYAGLSHWTISRYTVGLPRIGQYDQYDNLPFDLICSDESRPKSGAVIVEVHPAVAIWMWCRDKGEIHSNWRYKKYKDVLKGLWKDLSAIKAFEEALPDSMKSVPKDDDVFDARVAYVLGSLWINGSNDVILLGDRDCGSFLVPNVPEVVASLSAFLKAKR